MSHPEPHPVSSPSKAVDVIAVLDETIEDFVNDDCGYLAERMTKVQAVAAEWRNALMAIAASRIEATGSPPVPYLTAEQAWHVARAALSTIGESP